MKRKRNPLTFYRMSGSGNTFFFYNNTQGAISKSLKKDIVTKLCRGQQQLEADGFVFVEKSNHLDFKWDFFNSDGSAAEMCGNAARCAGLFYAEKIKKQETINFETLASEIEAQILSSTAGLVEIKMPRPSSEKRVIIEIENKNIEGFFVNTGVPHFVCEYEPELNLAEKIRNHAAFGVAGANATFISKEKDNEAVAITFERGVEDFTLACGTGAVAAARYLNKMSGSSEILVNMPGGPFLISFTDIGETYMLSHAQFDFEVKLEV